MPHALHWLRASLTWIVVVFLGAATLARSQTTDWTVQVTPFNQVFSALELSQAPRAPGAHDQSETTQSLGGGNGLITVHVRALKNGEHVHLRINSARWLSGTTQLDGVLAEAGHTYALHPAIEWNLPRLAAQLEPTAALLQFSLERDGTTAGARSVAIDLRPLNDALYFVRDGNDSVDLSWIFAAFVNENDGVVDDILKDARQSGIVEKFTGYAGGLLESDPEIVSDTHTQTDTVLRQVWAIWHVLSVHGIRYSGADPGIDRGPHVFSQRVRFLADTWADRSANCIDGSVLLASALQRIGLRSFLVLVPGHAFVGFYTDANAQHAAYLETTLLGDALALPQARPSYVRALPLSAQAQSSLASFEAALHAGAARHASAAQNFDGRHRPDFAIIDIAAARAFGIRSISLETAHGTRASGR